MALFDNSNIKLDVLKKRAFNYRWAEVPFLPPECGERFAEKP